MATVGIIGGGISGISAAYYLSKPAYSHLIKKIILIEALPKFGGWMRTTSFDDGTRFEHGPRSIRGYGDSGINTLSLVEELGLDNEMLPIGIKHPAANNRYIYVNNRLCALPSGLRAALFKQPPFSKSMVSYLWKEAFQPPSGEKDESIHSFITRRFGEELAEYAVDPMCRGIFAGDSKKLSIKSCFPDLYHLEKDFGSIIRGMLLVRKMHKKPVPESPLIKKFRANQWQIWSLRGGLQQLIDVMVSEIRRRSNVDLQNNASCTAIEFSNNNTKLKTQDKTFEVDAVFSSCLSKHLASLLPKEHKELSAELNSIPSVSTGVVSLQYPGKVMPVQGFGHLIPSCEPSKVLGVIYESSIFPEHDGQGFPNTRLTCMMGGAWFQEHFGGDGSHVKKSTLESVALDSIREQLGIHTDPTRVFSHIHKECIPQYLVGHSSRLDSIDKYIETNELPLKLIGSSYRGVSVNDCIHNAKLEAEKYQSKLL